MIPTWQQQGYSSYDQWALDNGLPTSTGQVDSGLALNSAGKQGLPGASTPIQYPQQPSTVNAFGDVFGSSSSGGTGTAAPTGKSLAFSPSSGRFFDLNDPLQAEQYYKEA